MMNVKTDSMCSVKNATMNVVLHVLEPKIKLCMSITLVHADTVHISTKLVALHVINQCV